MTTATLQEVPTFNKMIAELVKAGTVAGYGTLEQMLEARVGLIHFAQTEGIGPDGRLRQLGGISLSMGMTMAQLAQQKHDELVRNLKNCVEKHPALASRQLQEFPLLLEIKNWQH